jgi:[protein-PII] uridylyltransferase
VVALGGNGRRELCPRSDVDLLFLLPADEPSVAAALTTRLPERLRAEVITSFVNMVLYGLWDLGLEVGHSARTVAECLALAAEDQSIKTGLLEARLIQPSPAPNSSGGAHPRRTTVVREDIFCELERAIDRDVLSGRGAERLITQKLVEANRRRERYGNTIYLLEPEVKQGEGGLRELHTALWVARARWRAHTLRDLYRVGVLSPREGRALERAYGFLTRVRVELHLAAGRRRDSLGFEYQESIAEHLGYISAGEVDRSKRAQGTERFMRAYYFHARQNRRISRLVIERANTPHRGRPASTQAAPGGFKVFGGELTVTERDQFQRDPAALIRIFKVAQEEGLDIYSYTKELIIESIGGLDRRLRRDPAVVGDFLAILEDPHSDGTILDLMHELGVLRTLIPEARRITARWKHSLYHVYTVDVHSLFVVKTLKKLRAGMLMKEQAELTRLIADLPRPAVLYLAAFLHDIGKGWIRGDHSARGAVIARVVGDRLAAAGLPGWGEEETADLVWLVKEHLLMADVSQRRDLSDQELIESFAANVASEERLSMLYLLTYADMRSTSPKMWTEWKGSLLAELYDKARAPLSSEAGPVRTAGADPRAHMEARRKRAVKEIREAAALAGRPEPPEELASQFAAAVDERYLLAVRPIQMLDHLEHWRLVSEGSELSLQVRHHRRTDTAEAGTTELTVICPDRPGLLSLLAGTLAANRLQILSAQIFSVDLARGAGKAALDILYLQDSSGGASYAPERWDAVRTDLLAVLAAGDAESLVDARVRGSRLPRRPKPTVETKVLVVGGASRTETVVDVFCQDHLGALYNIARAFAREGLTIRLAKISTVNDYIADGFYVADARTQEPIRDEARQKAIAEAVRRAIDAALAQ